MFPEGFLYLLGLFIYKGQAAQCQPGAACPIQFIYNFIYNSFTGFWGMSAKPHKHWA